MKLLKKALCFVLVAVLICSNQVYALGGNETSTTDPIINTNSIPKSQIQDIVDAWQSKTNVPTSMSSINSLSEVTSEEAIKKEESKSDIRGFSPSGSTWCKEALRSSAKTQKSNKSLRLASTAETKKVYNPDELATAIKDFLYTRTNTVDIDYIGDTTYIESTLDNIFIGLFSNDNYLYYSTWGENPIVDKYVGGATIHLSFQYLLTYQQEQYVDSQVDTILSQIITDDMNDSKREKAIHDYIVTHSSYYINNRTAYDLLAYGETNCLGYALLAYKMYEEAGVDALIISGQAGGGGHAWNMVKLAGNWYHVDSCWDDPVPDVAGRILYDYYNLSDAQMGADHTWDHSIYPACLEIFDRSVVDTAVTFPDTNLNSLIHELLNKKASETIFLSDVLNITYIDGSDRQISNLEGMQYLTNLEVLYLYSNNINNISVLSSMAKLVALGLDGNNISDFSPLSNMNGLTYLSLTNNKITDISVIAGLTNLDTLYLDRNQIKNIKPISGMTKLIRLYLDGNNISDFSPLSNVKGLISLSMSNNNITDISVVAGMTNLEQLYLYNNNISNISVLGNLTKLSRLDLDSNNISDLSTLSNMKGLIYLSLANNNITDISVVAGMTNLEELYLYNNYISNISVLSNLTKLSRLALDGNKISDLSPLSKINTLTCLNLANNNITDISVIAGLTNLEELYLYNNNINNISVLSNLTKLSRLALNGNNISDFSPLSDMKGLTYLSLSNNNINDISVIAGLTNLEELYLYCDKISNISALSNLTKLNRLTLDGNNISDFSPLSDLKGLTYLSLSSNNITNISAIAGLTNLEELYLYCDKISNISVVSNLTKLSRLALNSNNISDLSPLSKMKGLTYLNLANNNITDISVIAGLTNLEELYLYCDKISNISVVNNLTKLNVLTLNGNNISNFSPLSNLKGLTILNLANNNITDTSVIAGLTNLEELYLYNDKISNISFLNNLTKLSRLALDGNNISDYSPLSNMKGLTYLSLTNNNITDISLIAGLTNLRELYLDRNQIFNITPIANLTNLKYLNLNENMLEDITPISSLINLKSLDIPNNKIKNINPVSNLINLTSLSLGYNSISDISPISSLANLKRLFLVGNSIQNIESIKGCSYLIEVYLSYNLITDIRPLSGLTNITSLYLSGNPIIDYSPVESYYANLTSKDFDINVNNIVSLTDIKIDGKSIEGFNKYDDKYEVILPESSEMPDITYIPSKTGAEVKLSMPTELPGTATIEAISLDKEWSITYEVNLYVSETLKVEKNKLIGGTGSDVANKIEPTYDGGYVITGQTQSNDGDMSGSHGGLDAFIIKVDAADNIEWTKCYGGGNDDYFEDIKQTPDGGYIAVGCFYLHDIVANPDDLETMAWVVKTDKNGNILWEKKDFKNGFKSLRAVFTAPDGGYYVAGDSISEKGDRNIGIIKLNVFGEEEWNNSYGGTENESLESIDKTLDNGFIMSALSSSNNGDCYVQKIDALGNSLWYKYYIGSQFDDPASIKSTPDGGYLMALTTCSNDYDMEDNKNTNFNRCLIKMNNKGEKEWANFDGKGFSDTPQGLYVFKDGCSLLNGNYNTSESYLNPNTYLTKLSPMGKIISDTVIKGNSYDYPTSILVKGNKYILAGYTTSTDLGTVNKGNNDIWLAQLTSSFTYKNNENDITVFSLGAQIEPTAIDTVNHVVTVKVYKGTSLAGVTPVIGVSPGASISYKSGTAINLSEDTTFTVTAEDGSEQDWSIKPVYVARTNAKLSNISVNGTTIKGFSPDILHYEVELPYGTTKVPFVYAQAQESTTIINLNKTAQIPGTTTIRTYAQDLTKSLTYTIDFKVADSPMIDWQNIINGNSCEISVGIENTLDGGYISIINTLSNNDIIPQNHGGYDILAIKYDRNNKIEWKKCFGGSDSDYAYSVTQGKDGGYVISGKTNSVDGDLKDLKSGSGGYDYDGWIFKLDSAGNILWNKCVDDGGNRDDSFRSISVLRDGGYIAVGMYASDFYNGGNAWLVKFSAQGEKEWEKNFGGNADDQFSSVIEADDGGFIAAGQTKSLGGDVQGLHKDNYYENYDGWVVKFNTSGKIVWQKCLGGTAEDSINSIIKTNDGKIIGVGYAKSYDGDLTGRTGADWVNNGWIFKLSSTGALEESKLISGTGNYGFSVIRRLNSGGFIALGVSDASEANAYRFDDSVNSIWRKPISNIWDSEFRGGIIQKDDGSYLAVTPNYTNDQYDSVITHIQKDTPPESSEVKDECFIATAAYGSKYMPAVSLLRKFRDKFLLTNSIGTAFVKFYYKNSPPIADYIRDRGYLRTIVRILLTPLIMIAYLLFHPEGLIPLVVVFLFNWYMRRRQMNS